MTYVFVDYETRSPIDLKRCGQDVYLSDAEVVMVGVGREDGYVSVMPRLRDCEDVTFVSWGGFDREVARRVEKLDCPNWIDARALAQTVGLPASLEKFCTAIGVEAKKDPRGTRLINKYCKPQEDGTFRELTPEDRQAMEDYCLQDVRLLQQAWRFLSPLVGEWQRVHQANWETYDRMNRRGVPIDVEACRAALKLIGEQTRAIESECKERFGFSTTQTAKVCEFLGTPDVTKQTLEGYRSKDPDQMWVRDARLITSRAAAKKLVPMIEMAREGRIRGAFHYHGAHTGRGTSMGVQFQNLKKGVIDFEFFRKLHAGEPVEDPIQQTQQNIRGFIKADEGKTLVIVDYSQVEARILAWIAGESYLTEAFAGGRDIYREFAASVYGVSQGEVTDTQRAHGKATVLGCFAGETLVLTDRGWVRIDSITRADKLWDGGDWVWHDGVIAQGEKETVRFGGVDATPDHLILAEGNWIPWSEVCGNHLILQSALDSASLPSSGGRGRSSGVGRSGGQFVDVPAVGRGLSVGTTSERADQPVVMGALKRKQSRRSQKNTGGTRTFVRMLQRASGYLLGFRLASVVATIPITTTSITTGVAASRFSPDGETHTAGEINRSHDQRSWVGRGFWSTSCRFLGMMTQIFSWIGSITTGAMSRGISVSSAAGTTCTTDALLLTSNSESMRLRRRSQTYDIANAGPHNRYTIITNHGPLIAHNCGYGMGPKKLVVQAASMGTIIPARASTELVERYRRSYPAIPMLWQAIDLGIKGLIRGRNEVFTAGKCIFTINPPRTMLRIELPSGRVLRYFKPSINSEQQIVYIDRNGPVRCWGGHFTENVVQAIASDLKLDFMRRADDHNFHAVAEVHDEVVFEEYEELSELVLKVSLEMMTETPEWLDCPGLIKGEGKISPRYTK